MLPAVFVITLAASLLTLVYSDVFGFAPCGLCWLQRVFLYPMPVIAAIAYFAKDSGMGKYLIGLGIPGFLIALYQHYIQMGGADTLPCPAAPGAADCAAHHLRVGPITFPLMAVTAFALVIALMLAYRKRTSAHVRSFSRRPSDTISSSSRKGSLGTALRGRYIRSPRATRDRYLRPM